MLRLQFDILELMVSICISRVFTADIWKEMSSITEYGSQEGPQNSLFDIAIFGTIAAILYLALGIY